jgi:GT2 family glycosyltransferase
MKIRESPTYQSLTSALNHCEKSASLFVYDNSFTEQKLLADQCWSVYYQHDPSNPGVSKAYNEGFKKAKMLNKKWLLLVDQDSTFRMNIFEKHIAAFTSYPDQELFSPIVRNASSIISPFRFAFGRGSIITNVRSGLYSLTDYKFINNGLLVSINLYAQSNGYDEHFPLDFSDLAFIQRARKLVDQFVVIDADCCHSLSSSESSIELSLNRFRYFASASKVYGQLYGLSFFLFVNRCLRCIKLSYRFKSLGFFKILILE